MIRFTDFYSGIGGGRVSLANLSMNGLGFSEIEKDAGLSYREFFGFDFMVGIFPCQTFSIVGKRCGLEV